MGFLTEMVERVRAGLRAAPARRHRADGAGLRDPPAKNSRRPSRAAEPPALIAEVKRASPSAGRSPEDVNPASPARGYQAGGAAAVSVLTEPRHFGGRWPTSGGSVDPCRSPCCGRTSSVHPAQIIEARADGADAVLLIVAALTDAELGALLGRLATSGMAALVETHGRRARSRGRDGAGDRGELPGPRDARGRRDAALEPARPRARATASTVLESGVAPARTSRRGPRRPGRMPSWWARR